MDVHMNELLQATIDEGGSDLHIRARMPPELRVHGELCPLSDEALTEEDAYNLVREISTDEQMEEVEKNGGADFALAHPDGTRFRVSVFKERKRYGAVLRQIPSTLLTLEQIGIPPTVKELLRILPHVREVAYHAARSRRRRAELRRGDSPRAPSGP